MRILRIVAVVGLVVLFTGCCACRRNRSVVPLAGVEWRLTQLYGAGVTSENYRVTLGVDGRLSGVGDCNRFSGTYTQTPGESRTGGALAIGDGLVATRMMCLGQAREDQFFAMLREVDAYSIDGERLMLIRGGDVLAIFDLVN
ncbi:MAG: META domain-containing protein [Alistipes sp.]|jgi:heat shock protein HslJ|nr:META domain-containing protein [Alistipes sp.]